MLKLPTSEQKFIIMKRLLLLALIFLGLKSLAQTPDANGRIYVNASITGGTGSGNTWTNAVSNLVDVVSAAKTNASIKEIWVAQGTYYPSLTSNRDDFFYITRNDLKLYGGFAGTETLLSQRNISTNITILSGNLGNPASTSDNSYHIMVIDALNTPIDNSTQIDGFTFQDGNASAGSVLDDYFPRYSGSAILVYPSDYNNSPLISNNIFKDNSQYQSGALSIDRNTASSNATKVQNCYFYNNYSKYAGGALSVLNYSETDNSNVEITDCIFEENIVDNTSQGGSTGGTGAAIRAYTYGGGNNVTINRSKFINNKIGSNTSYSGTYKGTAIAAGNGSTVIVVNSLIYADEIYIPLYNSSSSLTFINSTVYNPDGGTLLATTSPVLNSIQNSVFWMGGNSVDAIDGSGTTVTAANSVIFPKYNVTLNGSNIYTSNPLFTDIASGDFTLQSASAAVNMGSNILYTSNGGSLNDTDLAGNDRIKGGSIDMGAYESPYNPTPIPDAAGIVYIKKGGTGNFNGSSWANAAPELADALIAAKNNTSIKEIWVANGTYKPLYSPADNNFGNADGSNNSFLMVKDVKLYGGFEGTETNIAQRVAVQSSGTILSGDINGDDVISGSGSTLSINNNTENAHFVVMAVGQTGNMTMDGFTVEGGYNVYDGSSPNSVTVNGNVVYFGSGSGIYINATELSDKVAINNCHFRHNDGADYGGGALFVWNTESLTISNCIFEKNRSTTSNGQGGAIYNSSSIITVTNSLFTGNRADYQGGAVFTNYNCTFINCTFSENYGGTRGHVLRRSSGTINFYNSILWNAGAAANSMVSNGSTSNMRLTNCIISNQTTGYGTQTMGSNATSDPLFTNAINGDFTLKSTSPAISTGSNSLFTGLNVDTKDLAGNTRVYNYANGGIIDMGAYEYQGENTLTVNLLSFTATVQNNSAKLEWQTASETSNKEFIIYRSGDDKIFVRLETVSSGSSGSYSYIDKTPLNGNNYYKLVQIDNDGRETELGVRILNFGLPTSDIQLFPNPTNSKTTVTFTSGKYHSLSLTSVEGRILKTITLNPAQTAMELDLSAYPSGIYFVRLAGNGQTESRKVVNTP